MKRQISLLLTFFLMGSCTIKTESQAPDSGYEQRLVKDYYQTSGTQNFILPLFT